MMTTRAYSFSSAQGSRSGRVPTQTRQSDTRHSDSNRATKHDRIRNSPHLAAISPPAPSKPVVIPTRTKSERRQSKTRPRVERVVEDRLVPHDARAVPPSAAAFLAITPFPDAQQTPSARFGRKAQQKHARDILQETADHESSVAASSESSPHSWKLLLSPPQETEDESSIVGSEHTTFTPSYAPSSLLRSFSSESMPSLDTDTESTHTSSSPSTPGIPLRRQGLRDRRSKSISSSVPEDCNSDHPLLMIHPPREDASDLKTEDVSSSDMTLPIPAKTSLKSNLTASFRRLKSAARIFSNRTAPSASRDEAPTRATLSEFSKIASERRPLPWAEPPDPALRRYLNPITISPAELYTHRDREEGESKPSSPRSCTASIQMQTYRPGIRKSDQASAPPVFHGVPPDEPAVLAIAPRQREPRENSDFLRVIVLEMNMRKVGKLSDAAPGRARLWLPARQASPQSGDASGETPRRWVSLDV
ncbi:MAG: hypothetical protein Q9181_000193 [Wetmoreana brouardii]